MTHPFWRTSHGMMHFSPSSPATVYSMRLSGSVVPHHPSVSFTAVLVVFTAQIHTSSKFDVQDTAVWMVSHDAIAVCVTLIHFPSVLPESFAFE